MGTVCRAQGRYAEAETLFRRALAIREKALGPERPEVAKTLDNYAELLRKDEQGGRGRQTGGPRQGHPCQARWKEPAEVTYPLFTSSAG